MINIFVTKQLFWERVSIGRVTSFLKTKIAPNVAVAAFKFWRKKGMENKKKVRAAAFCCLFVF